MGTPSTKERIRARRRQERVRGYLVWGGVAAAAVLVIGGAALRARQRSGGDDVPIPEVEPVPTAEETSHVPEGIVVAYNSDPPTSGRHYSTQAFAGFYDEEQAADFNPFPAGYLVHSLEHGYVIFWYDCEGLATGDCEDLKADIQQVMGRVGDYKVIGFPWPSLEVPVAMTSWGRMLRFEQFDPDLAEAFVRNNRENPELAPEIRAP
ncbi:MAG: DUF3105 domain-containing protein [Anaerolineales bacterium]